MDALLCCRRYINLSLVDDLVESGCSTSKAYTVVLMAWTLVLPLFVGRECVKGQQRRGSVGPIVAFDGYTVRPAACSLPSAPVVHSTAIEFGWFGV